MLFLGMANAYVMRTNMSVAIVAMTNQTFIKQGHEDIFDDECPNTNYTAQTKEDDGEFNWTSSQQGYVLSSFFYGYVITQVSSLTIFTMFLNNDRVLIADPIRNSSEKVRCYEVLRLGYAYQLRFCIPGADWSP